VAPPIEETRPEPAKIEFRVKRLEISEKKIKIRTTINDSRAATIIQVYQQIAFPQSGEWRSSDISGSPLKQCLS